MSTAMQSDRSPDDQVRVCRERAAADGVSIPDDNVFVDRAVSGTKPDRTALAELKAAALARRFTVLYVEDLSRLSRESSHMMMLLKELVYEDVRIISVNEGIDSASDSWHILATILGLKHEQDIRDLGHRVRRGQKGAVLNDYSAGDRCFGYASEPVADASPRRDRNRRIPRRVVVDPAQSAWVVRIFEWFAFEKRSMNWIADELTRLSAPKDHRATTPGWHHAYVKKVLTNEKYIGIWRWGASRVKRHPRTGRIRQVAVNTDEIVVRHRPDLRIVPPELWDAAQRRLAEVQAKFDAKGPKRPRPTGSFVDAYPPHEFAGLLFCSRCGARMVVAGSNGRYMACGGRVARRCDVRTMAPRAWLKALLIGRIREELVSGRQNLDGLLATIHELIEADRAGGTAERARLAAEERSVERSISNLLSVAEAGGGAPLAILQRMSELEARRGQLRSELSREAARGDSTPELPAADWLRAQIDHLDEWLPDAPSHELAEVFRAFTGGRIEMHAIVPRGKVRGHYEARFGGNVISLLLRR